MQDDFAGQGFGLLDGDGNGRLQVMHFGIAAARVDAFAVSMSAKIEEQDIVAAVIFQGCYGAQVGAADSVSMADDNGRRWMGLCPELAVQEFAVACAEEQQALACLGRLCLGFGHFPGEAFGIDRVMWSGKIFHKVLCQHDKAAGDGDARNTRAGSQAQYPAMMTQLRTLLLYASLSLLTD